MNEANIHIFNSEQLRKADEILANPLSHLSSLTSSELRDLAVVWCYSAKDADILHYRRGLIAFYESGDYTQYADYFLDRQLNRLKEISF